MIVAQLEERCTNQSIATELAIQAKSEPSKVELPEVYKKYDSIFSEEEVQSFPPLVPGTTQSISRVGPQTLSIARYTL